MTTHDPFLTRWLRPLADRLIVHPLSEVIFKFQLEVNNHMSELSDAVQSVKDGQAKIADDVQQVIALLQQPNPDVAAAVAALQGIATDQAKADADLDALTGVPNPPTP